jgi:hypothetical protein
MELTLAQYALIVTALETENLAHIVNCLGHMCKTVDTNILDNDLIQILAIPDNLTTTFKSDLHDALVLLDLPKFAEKFHDSN